MSPIIAGHFALERDAQRAVEGLRRQGFAQDDVTCIAVNPLAQSARDSPRSECDPASVESGEFGQSVGTLARRSAAGEATVCVLHSRPRRRAGTLVAVRAAEYAKRLIAVNVLQAYGARDVERADGTWIAGRWIDFDPSIPPRLVDPPVACEQWISRREPR